MKGFAGECLDTFNSYATTVSQKFKYFILDKCTDVQNLKLLFSIVARIQPEMRSKIHEYRKEIEKIENICCMDEDFNAKRRYVYRTVACMTISDDTFNNTTISSQLHSEISRLDMIVPTRDDYNKIITKYREDRKIHALNILKSKSKEEKDQLKFLKEANIYNYIESDVNPNTNSSEREDFDKFVYKGEDENSESLH